MAAAVVDPSPSGGTPAAEPAPPRRRRRGAWSPSVLMPPRRPRPRATRASERPSRPFPSPFETAATPPATRAPAVSGSPRPGPSPGKAAREAAESAGVDSVDAVADAVANATPGSVTDRRKRRGDVASPAGTDPSAPSPRRVALPETPFGEPRAFASPELSRVTPVAPNAARLIATPGKRASTSPLSVFARMMAKVIVDAGRDVDEGHTDGERRTKSEETPTGTRVTPTSRGRGTSRGGGGAADTPSARRARASSFEESVRATRPIDDGATERFGVGERTRASACACTNTWYETRRVSHLARRETFSLGVAARTRALFFPSHRLSSPPPAPARPLRRLLLPPRPRAPPRAPPPP